MSSPPTPNTSTKAAPLCASRPKIREKSSLFSSIPILNLFYKKPLPHRPSPPFEPYEVAPGIWSTDATARVFGCLDSNNKRVKSRVQSAGPEQTVKRKPVPIRGSLDRCKQTLFDRPEQCNANRSRDESEAAIQFRQKERDEPKTKRGGNWSGTRREKMRTVSRDDQLVERGANPRTGLVSPFIVSDNSEECLGGDYIAVNEIASAGPLPSRRTRSGKWKQDSLGWSLVESPLLGPIAQSMGDNMSRTVSMKQLEDRLLVQMPSKDKPNPINMTYEQIKKYQEGIARAYKRGGGNVAMLDPDTLPSPRQRTPEGPSTPPVKLHKIQRKEVGSGVVCKSNYDDTVIINASNQASFIPLPTKDITKRQKDRIFAPSNTPKGSSFASYTNISNAMRPAKPFLGQGSGTACSLTASATQSQSYLNNGQAHQSRQNESESSPSATLSGPPPASHTLSQYLPHLQFLRPNHFANLETSSCHRPMLRISGQKSQVAEDACTTTFTITSTKRPAWEQRPKMQRHVNNVVARANPLSLGNKKPLDGYHQEISPRKKQSYRKKTSADTLRISGLATGRSQAIGITEKSDPARDLARTRYQRQTQMPGELPRQPPCENRPRNLVSTTHTTQGLSLGSANITRERIQRNLGGDGFIPIYGHPGDESTVVPGGNIQCISDDTELAALPAELTIGRDSKAWFAGRWAEYEEEVGRPDMTALTNEELLTRRASFLRKAGAKSWLYTMETWVKSLARLDPIQQLAQRMICHIIRTLHHASLALTTLKVANVATRDHFRAMKDLTLAIFYMLVLLNFIMALRGVLGFVSKVLYWVWYHPTQTILIIIRWCVFG